MTFTPVWGGMFHLTLTLVGVTFHSAWIDAHIVLRLHFGSDDLHVAFGSDLTASSLGMWLLRMWLLWN